MKAKLKFGEHIYYKCHCGGHHWFPIKGEGAWTWNGDLEKPTISPSVSAKGGMTEDWSKKIEHCHHFVRDGMIEYCGDSTHEHAGKTLPMIELDSP